MTSRPLALCLLTLSLAACQDANSIALKVGAPPDNAGQLRSLESRDLPAMDETALLRSATATLQDLGFTVTESASDAGVLSATKQRDAVETGQVAGQVVATVLLALLGAYHAPTWDKTQQINVTLVSSPSAQPGMASLRVSFDRYLTNNQGVLWRTELIAEPKIYSEFYDKLRQGLTLEPGRS